MIIPMSNLLFSLPESLIIKIFEYDNTYKDFFRKYVTKELWQKYWYKWLNNYEKKYNYEKSELFLFIFTGFATTDCLYDANRNIPLCYANDLYFLHSDKKSQYYYILWLNYKSHLSSKFVQVRVYNTGQSMDGETKAPCYFDEKRIMFVYLGDNDDDYF